MVEGKGNAEGALYLRMDDFPARLVDRAGRSRPAVGVGLGMRQCRRPARYPQPPRSGGHPVQGGHRGRAGRPARRRDDPVPGPVRQHASRCSTVPHSSTGGWSARTGTSSSPVSRASATWCCPRDDDEALHFYRDVLWVSSCATRCGCHRSWSERPADDAPAWLRFFGVQSAPPQPGLHADADAERHRAPDGRGREQRRRRAVPRPRAAAQGADVGDAGPARQRPDAVVLHEDAGRLRRRIRLRGPAKSTTTLGRPGEHRGQPVGPRLQRRRNSR